MALLQSRDGIACDLCKAECRLVFTYYSFELRRLSLSGERWQPWKTIKPVISLDVCQGCLDGYAQLLKKFYKYVKGSIGCDHCGIRLKSPAWHCQVIKAVVNDGETITDPHFLELCFCDAEAKRLHNLVKV